GPQPIVGYRLLARPGLMRRLAVLPRDTFGPQSTVDPGHQGDQYLRFGATVSHRLYRRVFRDSCYTACRSPLTCGASISRFLTAPRPHPEAQEAHQTNGRKNPTAPLPAE